ncbi:hypothetical protein, partial [Symbiopectobacterium sp.]|uniref:hypothetical protein n=1 Tax=Symbiopectobacterium sp. TaxID=2952789 RepID=UPI003F2B4F0E
ALWVFESVFSSYLARYVLELPKHYVCDTRERNRSSGYKSLPCIVSFCSDKNGLSLDGLEMAGLPVVDNYLSIVHDYMKSNEERFLIDYDDTKTKGILGGDELMDCSCFFLRNNDDIRRAFFAHGLMNMDMVDILRDDMNDRFPNDESPRGGILTVIHNSLVSLYKLNTDYM